jgi:hypothetical protein
MPATTTTSPFDTHRACPAEWHDGERVLPFTSDNFYIRPNGSADYWCRECVRTYNRRQRAARQANGGGRRFARKFGVEIECIVDRYSLVRELQARGLRVHDVRYTHEVRAGQWKVVTDASVYNGFELVSPPLKGDAGIAELKLACEALDAAGATINRACGLHVHHDVGDLDTRAFGRLFRAWSNNQANTDFLVARSRRGSQWARPLRADEVARTETLPATDRDAVRRHLGMVDRYRSLNVACFPRYGTVEVRQHQGTTNFAKIAAWIAYGQAVITLAKSANGDTSCAFDTTAWIDRLAGHGLTAQQATYLRGRAAHFQGHRQPVAA